MRVKVGGKIIPASFMKIEGRGTLVGAIGRREGQIEELVVGQNPGPEALPEAREEGEKEMSGEERWRRVGVSGSLKGGDDPVEYLLLAGVGSTS